MRDWFEILQEEARARRAALRDDGEPLQLALARAQQQPIIATGLTRGWYLPATGIAMGMLCISAVVLIDFENKVNKTAWEAEKITSQVPAPPTVVIGDTPGVNFSSKRYDAPIQPHVIDTVPVADRVAAQLKFDDPRLLKPVEGAWQRAKLRRVANEIMMRTHIRLIVDPELAENRVTVYAGEKASTLQLMRGMAHLYGSGWFRSESAAGQPYTYTLQRFDTPYTRGWLNALYQAPQRHAPGMDRLTNLSSPTHLDWLERLHKETGRTVISDDTGMATQATSPGQQSLFQALCTRASNAGQLWDSHAGALTFRKAPPIGDSLLPVSR